LEYVVGIESNATVWEPGQQPLPVPTRKPGRGAPPNPTFALGGHFLTSRQKMAFAFNVGTAKISENKLGEDLASFLRHPSLACCC
jgi:hypothetical protein